ncbi:glycosyltransferase [Eisenbergiella massiliensis]|uniref:glycosyltransferase n=1 Tax=Eisenbergiella massiliensis TaxID=1720294 RepID=UPI0039965354
MEKIRIVHTIPMGAGGISNLTLTINEKINRDRFEFNYLVFRNQKEFCDERAARLGSPKLIVDVSKNKNSIVKGLKKVFGTIEILKREKIEIMHIDASTPYDVILAVAAKMAGVTRIIFHAHNDNYERKVTLRNAMQPIFRMLIPFVVTDYIAISKQAADFLFPKSIARNNRYYLFKNGIDVEKYVFNPAVRNQYREKYNWENHFVIGHVGRFVYQKNHDFVIDIFNEIVKTIPNALLILVGIGELQAYIKAKVVQYDLETKIIFYGVTDDVANLMQAMDSLVFPSKFEGLGMVAIESQCAGLPTIVSDMLPKEVEITNYIKKISLSKSAREWADEILNFSSSINRKNCGDAVREKGYDINKIVNQLEVLYGDDEK